MFRFNASKPRRRQDITLTLVYKALDKSEELFDVDPTESQKYFQRAETLYNHWCTETGKGDYEVNRKLDDLWVGFMARVEGINLRV